ncbi:MAG: hypothetical protein WC627_12985 [Legionella sp.]|jgi:hypothetical protein
MKLQYFLTNILNGRISAGYNERELKLHLSEITTDNAQATKTKLSQLRLISFLTIDLYNATEFQIQCFFDGIKNNQHVTSLAIRYNNSDVEFIEFITGPLLAPGRAQIQLIATQLKENTFLKTLHLSTIPMWDESTADILFSFLRDNKSLESLNVHDVIDENVIKAVFKAVKQRESSTNLSFKDWKGFKMVFTSEMIDSLAIADGINTSLRGLHFDNVKMSEEQIIKLTSVLEKYKNIDNLSMVHSCMTDKLLGHLINYIKTNNTLKKIDIHSNPLGNAGLKLLGDELRTNTSLSSINLSDTGLSAIENLEEGWNYLLICLQTNTTLKQIIIGLDHEGLAVQTFECWSQIETLLADNVSGRPHAQMLFADVDSDYDAENDNSYNSHTGPGTFFHTGKKRINAPTFNDINKLCKME